MDYSDDAMLSKPLSIRRRFVGYDRDEVDRRINRLLQMVVDGKQVRKMQEGTIRILEAQINDYRESQALVRALFAKAEDEAQETLKRAGERGKGIEEQAGVLLAEARNEAATIRAEADRYVEQTRAEIERQAKDALRALAFAENFEKVIGKPAIGGMAGELLGRHILMFLRELSEAAKEATAQESGQR